MFSDTLMVMNSCPGPLFEPHLHLLRDTVDSCMAVKMESSRIFVS